MNKTSILLLSVLFASSAINAGTVTTYTYTKSSPRCDGSGICTVTTTSNSESSMVRTDWTVGRTGTTLTMLIHEDMADNVPANVLSNLMEGRFIMQSPFVFPNNIALMLGVDNGITIPAGTYSVTHDSKGYMVTFSIEQ